MTEATDGTAPTELTFKVKASNDKNHTITMSDSSTVLDLKNKLAGEEYENVPAERQRLIYSGKVLKNDEKLSTYKIKSGNTIHLVKSAASNPAPAPASDAPGSAPAAPAVPTNMAAGTANNLLAGLTGARYAGQINLPSASMFGADGGMGAPPGEDEVINMLSDPNVASQMREALNNPDVVNMLIQSNPMLRDMPNAREIINSPMFRNMMTNPDTMRQARAFGRQMGMGGSGAPAAFPAPGATNTTPAGANTGTTGAATGTTEGGAAAGTGAAAPNPFAALMGMPGMGFGAQPGATANATSPPATGVGAPNAAAANPFASLFAGANQGGAGTDAANNPFGLPPVTPEMMQQFAQMMGQNGGMGGLFGGAGMGQPAAPPDNRPPEERYAEQLRQLNDMGFFDFDSNVNALRRSGGSVHGAIEHLLNN